MHFDNYTFALDGFELATWFMTQAEAKRVARLLSNAYPGCGLKLQRVGNAITESAPNNRMDKCELLERRVQMVIADGEHIACFADHDGVWGPVYTVGDYNLLYAAN